MPTPEDNAAAIEQLRADLTEETRQRTEADEHAQGQRDTLATSTSQLSDRIDATNTRIDELEAKVTG